MTRSALRRITEAFFQRWPLYALIFLASLAIGYSQVRQTADLYISNGAISVDDETLVTAQSGVRSGPSFNYLSPAQFTSQELYGLIVTDVFMESVTESAGIELPSEPNPRAVELQDLRLSMSVYPSSSNILQIDATTPDPQRSADLVQGVIDEFIKFQIRIDIAESEASEEFFIELSESYRQDVVDARADVDASLRGIESLEDISPEQELGIDRLKQAEAQADSRYQEAVEDLGVARLAALQTETDIRQSYSVLDIPEPPSEAGGRLFDDLVALAMFGLVGAILALMLPVFSALTNRTLVFADDLDPDGPAQVVATVPRTRKRRLDLRRVGDVEQVPVGQLAPPMGPPPEPEPQPAAPSPQPVAVPQREAAAPTTVEPATEPPAHKVGDGGRTRTEPAVVAAAVTTPSPVVEPVPATVEESVRPGAEPVVARAEEATPAMVEASVAAVAVSDPVAVLDPLAESDLDEHEAETILGSGVSVVFPTETDETSDPAHDADVVPEAAEATADDDGQDSSDAAGEEPAEDDVVPPVDAGSPSSGPSSGDALEEAGESTSGQGAPAAVTELMVELHDLEFDSYPDDVAEPEAEANGHKGENGHGENGRNGTNGDDETNGQHDA